MNKQRFCRTIRAYDLDGTLCKGICWTESDCLKAEPVQRVIDNINKHYEDSITLIHTARADKLMGATIQWLREKGVHYWAISNQKLKADVYIDDLSVNPKDL